MYIPFMFRVRVRGKSYFWFALDTNDDDIYDAIEDAILGLPLTMLLNTLSLVTNASDDTIGELFKRY